MSRQFDVHRNSQAPGLGDPPLLVNLQTDFLSDAQTVIVAPMWLGSDPLWTGPLSVVVDIDEELHSLSSLELAFVRRSSLGPAVANLSAERDRIVRALDFVFTGV